MIMCASASTFAAPPMSFFISSMPLDGLDVEPAGVEADALADQRDLRRVGIAPGAGRSGAARAADARPTAWISGKFSRQQIVADDRADLRAVCAAASARAACFELGRPHVVGRRVDEIAREKSPPSTMRDELVADRRLAAASSRAAFVGLAVAGEAVGAEREGERRQPRVVRRVGEPVGAGRQQSRQTARPKRVAGRRIRRRPCRTAHRPVLSCHPCPAATSIGRVSARTRPRAQTPMPPDQGHGRRRSSWHQSNRSELRRYQAREKPDASTTGPLLRIAAALLARRHAEQVTRNYGGIQVVDG